MSVTVKTRTRYAIVGGDYSQQEPRLLTELTQEPNLVDTYTNERDLYATICSLVFHKDYWECMEHWEDGSPNPVGKKIRKKGKTLVLGITYGMGAKLMADLLKVSVDECKEILNEFYKMFPAVKEFTLANEQAAKEIGYVEDYMGRRRHLPDASLPELEIRAKKPVITDTNVFMDCTLADSKLEIPDADLQKEWEQKLVDWNNQKHYGISRFDVKNKFKELAKQNNIDVFDNGAFLSRASTQCTNARIQGSAATLTKKSMTNIFNDAEMARLGFRILVPVHDELLGECPLINAEEAGKRLVELMISSALPECKVPMKVDTYTVHHWYADEMSDSIYEEYTSRLDAGENADDIFADLVKTYSEFTPEVLKQMCLGTFDVLQENL